MELKLEHALWLEEDPKSLNRTFMELKHRNRNKDHVKALSLNRTFMELKHGSINRRTTIDTKS